MGCWLYYGYNCRLKWIVRVVAVSVILTLWHLVMELQ